MQFKCANCGGNVVYDPSDGHMKCMSCQSVDTEEVVTQEDSYSCPSCGAKLEVNDFTSATKCGYCGAYLIIDEKITYPYGPDLLIPFRFSKEQATELLRKSFKDKLFCPNDFLSERTLENLEGDYIPFWMYSYDTHAVWDGTGEKRRSWRQGDTEYTEISTYHVHREIDIDFNQVPVDASIAMPDAVMDLMEPYEYKDLTKFEPKYMSGYIAETYNQPPDALEARAKSKIDLDTEQWLASTMSGYSALKPMQKVFDHKPTAREFAMMPVWRYVYRYHNKQYEYYINGQTGKVYGKLPKSTTKIWFSTTTLFVALVLLLKALQFLVEVF